MDFINKFRHPCTRPGLYIITDRSLTPGGLTGAVEEALKSGAGLLQLREKDMGGGELLRLAMELRSITRKHEAGLLINDRVDVALASDADGVHLGRRSISPADTRKLLGPGRLIGVSTHSKDEALKAEDEGADFITFGPTYFTGSKALYGKPLGLEALRDAAETLNIPVYALGGITKSRVHEAIGAGAWGVAAISAVFGTPGVAENTDGLIAEVMRSYGQDVRGA